MLAQVAQRGGRCPIPGTIQGQVGRGSEQPDLVEDVPAHGRGLDEMNFKRPSQPKLFFDCILCSLLFQFVTVVSPDAQLNKELEFLSHIFCSFLKRALYWEDSGYSLCIDTVRCVSHSSFVSSQVSSMLFWPGSAAA